MKYYLNGRVLPERAGAFVTHKIERQLKGFGTLTFVCKSSQITMTIGDTEMDIDSVFFQAKLFASAVLSSLGFSLGCGYSVEMINVTDENGVATLYGVELKELAEHNHNPVFIDILNFTFADIYMRFSVLDYVRAITNEFECPFLCYRAIETIKAHFEGDGSKKKGWTLMHEELGTNEKEINEIKLFSDPIRHGKYSEFKSTTNQQRLRFLTTTKTIILLYLDYLKRKVSAA